MLCHETVASPKPSFSCQAPNRDLPAPNVLLFRTHFEQLMLQCLQAPDKGLPTPDVVLHLDLPLICCFSQLL